MKAARYLFVCFAVLSFGAGMQPADAARRKKAKKTAPIKATKQTFVGIDRLMGKFKWGMSSEKVLSMVQDQIRAEYDPKLKALRDELQYDKLRREMNQKLDEAKKGLVRFSGQRTPWDVSLVEREFGHKNEEAMLPKWEARERRFFFFYQNRLWKIFIAFNAEVFRGKSFEDFAGAMEGRFGRAERKYKANLKGDTVLSHLEWPPAARTMLRAVDQTSLYGNFCLVLINKEDLSSVREGRKQNSPKKNYSDPIVDAVTKRSGGSTKDENDDVVDQITGRGRNTPPPSTDPPTEKPDKPSKGKGKGKTASPDKPKPTKPGGKDDDLDL